ncbi:glycosyltransferase [Streptomyces sp. SID10853]|uniref:glycosyltransferase family 4 protein n=1 Tax=Streptomyces sp. SID10853 TaxID=2706028 RepID=UPI0013BF4D89|nr:glycosyltransferase family 4 protein [Streptomyces sp. SID10853]NDZ81302.1 glycosyltransferase [Streptomyces sp. SID10853]
MKISFLIHTVYGIGGTIKTTLNLAEELADRHDVEIVSVFRHRETPLFRIDSRITVVPLVDTDPASMANELEHPLHQQPSQCLPSAEARFREYSTLSDQRVRDHYATSDADVVIGTRPGLVAYVAQFAPAGAVLIGQEHMTHNHHKQALRSQLYEHLAALDAFVTVSDGDAAVYREKMPLPATRVLSIPNSVPEPPVAPSDGSGTTVVAAGRLAPEKQYQVLVDAFADVVAERPDWSLRIYGGGSERSKLRERIDARGLHNRVHLMGPHSPIEPEWAKGAIAVSTSRHESFGMTLVEAMRCGLPVVSTDCDYGPREIIEDGVDGLLVPVGDSAAVAAALLRLIGDEELRHRMSAAALANARRFDPSQVTKQYEDLFTELRPQAATRAGRPAFAPEADCVVRPDGELTVTLVPDREGPAAYDGLRLLCSRTDDRGDQRSYAFDARGVAVVPAGGEFAEGVWDFYAEAAGSGRRVRIAARSVDQRGPLRAEGGERVRNQVAYRLKDKGFLTMRSWNRPAHAEAGDIVVDGTRLTVSGRLLGAAAPSGDPVLLLRRRGGAGEELSFPGSREGTDGFRVAFPAGGPAARQLTRNDYWDVWLRYAPQEPPVKVGRILDDVVDKKGVYSYPPSLVRKTRPWGALRKAVRKVRGRPKQWVRVRPYYTVSNDLALTVADVQP